MRAPSGNPSATTMVIFMSSRGRKMNQGSGSFWVSSPDRVYSQADTYVLAVEKAMEEDRNAGS